MRTCYFCFLCVFFPCRKLDENKSMALMIRFNKRKPSEFPNYFLILFFEITFPCPFPLYFYFIQHEDEVPNPNCRYVIIAKSGTVHSRSRLPENKKAKKICPERKRYNFSASSSSWCPLRYIWFFHVVLHVDCNRTCCIVKLFGRTSHF